MSAHHMGPTVAAAGLQEVFQAVSHSFASVRAEDKAFQTLRARLALAGHALSRSDASDGARTYFASRWGMVRELCDLHAVEAFAQQVAA